MYQYFPNITPRGYQGLHHHAYHAVMGENPTPKSARQLLGTAASPGGTAGLAAAGGLYGGTAGLSGGVGAAISTKRGANGLMQGVNIEKLWSANKSGRVCELDQLRQYAPQLPSPATSKADYERRLQEDREGLQKKSDVRDHQFHDAVLVGEDSPPKEGCLCRTDHIPFPSQKQSHYPFKAGTTSEQSPVVSPWTQCVPASGRLFLPGKANDLEVVAPLAPAVRSPIGQGPGVVFPLSSSAAPKRSDSTDCHLRAGDFGHHGQGSGLMAGYSSDETPDHRRIHLLPSTPSRLASTTSGAAPHQSRLANPDLETSIIRPDSLAGTHAAAKGAREGPWHAIISQKMVFDTDKECSRAGLDSDFLGRPGSPRPNFENSPRPCFFQRLNGNSNLCLDLNDIPKSGPQKRLGPMLLKDVQIHDRPYNVRDINGPEKKQRGGLL